MSLLRTKAKPADLSAKMPLRLSKEGDILVDKAGNEGFIEFWAEDAFAIKSRLDPVRAEFTRLFMIHNKRSIKDVESMSVAALTKENQKMIDATVNGLVIRVKSWHLVSDEGEHVDVPVTAETARELFSDEDVRAYAQDWLENSKDAFLPKKSEG